MKVGTFYYNLVTGLVILNIKWILEKDKSMKEINLPREKENQHDNNLTVPLYRQFRQDALSNL